MEIESWVLADRDRTAAMLGISPHKIPQQTDTIPDPKQFLVNLARRSRYATVRQDLVPTSGSTASVGPAYNARLMAYVATEWNPTEAATASQSLARCMMRIQNAFQTQ